MVNSCKLVSYQLLFFIPGIKPLLASSLKHIRHNPNFRIYPLALPHLKHRRTIRVENLGFFLDFAIWALTAIAILQRKVAPPQAELGFNPAKLGVFRLYHGFIGNPNSFNSSSPSSLVLAFVTTVTSNPNIILAFSGKISGKIICSFIPIVRFPF